MCVCVGMLPLSNQRWLSPGASLSFQVLRSWVDTNSPAAFVSALATKLLNYSMSRFISKWCQIHSAVRTRCAALTYLDRTPCVLPCPLAASVRSPCPCIVCQHSLERVPGCTRVIQTNSCMGVILLSWSPLKHVSIKNTFLGTSLEEFI